MQDIEDDTATVRLPSIPAEPTDKTVTPPSVEAFETRKIGTLTEQETMIAYLAHEWTDKLYGKTGIIQFLDIRACQPTFSIAYAHMSTPPPLNSWRCIFQLADNRLVHVIVSERPIQYAVEFMFVEFLPATRAALDQHNQAWHGHS